MQQEFVKSLVEQKLNIALINKLPSIFSDIMNEIDTNLSIGDVIKYSKYLVNFTSAGIRSETIPGDNMYERANGDVLVPNMKHLKALVEEMFKNADTSKISYAKPNLTPSLSADGYMTTGGYVRTTSVATLSAKKPSEITNDELCLINGVVQTYTPPEENTAPPVE